MGSEIIQVSAHSRIRSSSPTNNAYTRQRVTECHAQLQLVISYEQMLSSANVGGHVVEPRPQVLGSRIIAQLRCRHRLKLWKFWHNLGIFIPPVHTPKFSR